MSLDKFGIGTPLKKTTKKSIKKSKSPNLKVEDEEKEEGNMGVEENQEEEEDRIAESESANIGGSSRRKELKCTNQKCGFKRILFKKELSEQDYICQRCGKTMKLSKK
jgi:hypothetical protein